MLNYINQNLDSPKMVPLKWCRRVGGIWGMQGVFWSEERVVRERGKATQHGIILTNWSCACPPLLCCVVKYGGCQYGGWMVKLCYLSCNDGASYKTPSHMCGIWYFLGSYWGMGSLTWMYMASFMFLMTPCDSLLSYKLLSVQINQ